MDCNIGAYIYIYFYKYIFACFILIYVQYIVNELVGDVRYMFEKPQTLKHKHAIILVKSYIIISNSLLSKIIYIHI